MPLREPMGQAVALQQVTKRAAGRKSFVAHRRKYEDFVDRELLRQNTVEPHVGEYAAGETEMAGLGRCKSRPIEPSTTFSSTF